jgi:hypothetical protein
MGIAPMERYGVKGWLLILSCLAQTVSATANGTHATNETNGTQQATVIVAVGAAGEEEFGKEFGQWAELWSKASDKAGVKQIGVGLATTNSTTDLDYVKQALASEPTNSTAELWLVLIGHGTYDGKEAKFNLRGPDLSATELADWLKPFQRPVIVINCASASSPFLSKLSGPNRVIVTATRSGSEENFARFGKYMAELIADPAADLDKDEQTSVLEAFIMASRRVGEFYEAEGRLATEHALLDDNGDGLGTAADFFRGVRAVKKPAGGGSVDGLRANQVHLVRSTEEQQLSPKLRERRDGLERAIARLRETKNTMREDDYYQKLEQLMLELAALYASPSKAD